VNAIIFQLALTERPYTFGHLWWPYKIRRIIEHEGFMEILDSKGSAVVSLADISLRDLNPGEPSWTTT